MNHPFDNRNVLLHAKGHFQTQPKSHDHEKPSPLKIIQRPYCGKKNSKPVIDEPSSLLQSEVDHVQRVQHVCRFGPHHGNIISLGANGSLFDCCGP